MANNLMISLKTKLGPKLPDILFGVGVTGVVAGTTLVGVAAFKLPGLIEEYKDDLELIKVYYPLEEDQKKELRKAKAAFAWKVARSFGLPVAIEVLSLISMFAGYKKVKTISAELAAVCATYDSVMKAYRGRVQAEVGEEKENELWLGGHEETVVKTETTEDGTNVTSEETQVVYDPELPSMYARWFVFGEASGAEKDLGYNSAFLKGQENMFNVYLRARKIVFLNDVYEQLGIKKTLAGNRVGWIYDPTKESPQINLRIQIKLRKNEDGTSTYAYLIDPNVEGVIDEKALALGYLAN